MIFRFCSGSVTPASLPRNRSLASTTRRSALKASRNSDSTCAASPARCSPVSTKMQVRRVADRPQHQRRRHRRIDAARQAADRAPRRPDRAVHRGHRLARRSRPSSRSARQPQIRNRKLARISPPRGRVRHLGVELHAPELARRRRHRRRRAVGALADHREPGRQRLDAVAVAHPDRDLLAGARTRGRGRPRSVTLTVARPYSRRSAATTLPPSSSAVSCTP